MAKSADSKPKGEGLFADTQGAKPAETKTKIAQEKEFEAGVGFSGSLATQVTRANPETEQSVGERFLDAAPPPTVMPDEDKLQSAPTPQTEMMVSRQAQEVQVSMLSAKRFPRDEVKAMHRIMATCQRPTLANQAIYSYPRGGQNVSGPSIRLAEAIAQNWGNLDTGIIELENRNGRSEMMAYAWDLETNTRVTKTFTVEHKRDTRGGSKDLTEGRDIYEATANFGARRMRACILSVVPGDIVEMAVDECKRTIASSDKRSVAEIVDGLLKAFKGVGVTKEQLEKWLGKGLTDALKDELVDLRGIYKAISDGQARASDYFGVTLPAGVMERIAAAQTRDELEKITNELDPKTRAAAAGVFEKRLNEVSK